MTWSKPIASPHAIGPRGWLRPSSSPVSTSSARADALPDREGGFVDELADDPAQHEAGGVLDPLGVRSRGGRRSPRPPRRRRPACPARGSAPRAAPSGGSSSKPTAPGSPRAARLLAAQSASSGAPPGSALGRHRSGVDHQLGRSALAQLVAGRPRALAQAVGERARRRRRSRACRRRHPAPAASGPRVGTTRPRRTRSSRDRSCGRARPRPPCAPGSGSAASAARRTTARRTTWPPRSPRRCRPGPSARTGPSGIRRPCGRCGRSARRRRLAPEQPQPLAGERPPAAVDEEAGAVGGHDHALAHRLAGRSRDRQRRSPV